MITFRGAQKAQPATRIRCLLKLLPFTEFVDQPYLSQTFHSHCRCNAKIDKSSLKFHKPQGLTHYGSHFEFHYGRNERRKRINWEEGTRGGDLDWERALSFNFPFLCTNFYQQQFGAHIANKAFLWVNERTQKTDKKHSTHKYYTIDDIQWRRIFNFN